MRKIKVSDLVWWLILLLLLFLLVMFSSCVPLGVTVGVDTNLPIRTTGLTVLNTTGHTFSVLLDGVEKAQIGPYGKFSSGLWNGAYYSIEAAVSVVGVDQVFAATEKIWIYPSAYGRNSYVLTIREDEDGRLWVERR